MTQTGIILNNEMSDFSIPGVQNIAGAGPPKVSNRRQLGIFILIFTGRSSWNIQADSFGDNFLYSHGFMFDNALFLQGEMSCSSLFGTQNAIGLSF